MSLNVVCVCVCVCVYVCVIISWSKCFVQSSNYQHYIEGYFEPLEGNTSVTYGDVKAHAFTVQLRALYAL